MCEKYLIYIKLAISDLFVFSVPINSDDDDDDDIIHDIASVMFHNFANFETIVFALVLSR